ncbi:NUDIX hydrolase [Evansella tamaricis]|uniref:NUDIX hydrolase n=1 Tax=Evansella tamaricis TaxID=2069301 RepID=A0ABS6JGF3_9BACI|nr:NUDIX hydrolase [Evansella tamaricis]MBU9712759.1 NUDIX hydrolase [Evansella tamaricis]
MTNHSWKIQQSDNVTVDRFHIQKDHVLLPNNGEMDFSYVSFEDGVCVLAITANNEIVILKQYRHAVKEWQWELPAGMIDQHEEPLHAAKRELLEETGYEAETWTALGYFHPSAGSTSETIHLFLAADLMKTSDQSLEESELISVYLKDWHDVMSLIQQGEFKHGAGLAAILKYKLLMEN